MPAQKLGYAPNLSAYLQSLYEQPLESSIERLIFLLKSRQIKNSKPCAIATGQLLLKVVRKFKWTDVDKLLLRIQQVGRRLIEAQPRELVVGNVVRRILGMIRDETGEDRKEDQSGHDSGVDSFEGSPVPEHRRTLPERPAISSSISTFSPLHQSALKPMDLSVHGTDQGHARRADLEQSSRPALMTAHTSMFNLLSVGPSPLSTPPGTSSPDGKSTMHAASLASRIVMSTQDLKAEIITGIEEILDEILQADDQIAAYALDHIHSNEIILTHSSSHTVQKFLLRAAAKRKFTVIHVESYPNDHEDTYAMVTGKLRREDGDEDDDMSTESFQKPLAAAGITVVVITDAAVFALMSRVNKVILATHAVSANGGLVAAAGARVIAKAAHKHRTPVIVLSGVYKLSPEYPFEFETLIEYGDVSKVISYEEGDLVDKLDVENPLFDYVAPELVDLYITNL
jgi:translation initiation factor eIF-2B subunit beta